MIFNLLENIYIIVIISAAVFGFGLILVMRTVSRLRLDSLAPKTELERMESVLTQEQLEREKARISGSESMNRGK